MGWNPPFPHSTEEVLISLFFLSTIAFVGRMCAGTQGRLPIPSQKTLFSYQSFRSFFHFPFLLLRTGPVHGRGYQFIWTDYLRTFPPGANKVLSFLFSEPPPMEGSFDRFVPLLLRKVGDQILLATSVTPLLHFLPD